VGDPARPWNKRSDILLVILWEGNARKGIGPHAAESKHSMNVSPISSVEVFDVSRYSMARICPLCARGNGSERQDFSVSDVRAIL
jgi:hypothetical protein